jgi:hypothetical protein
MQHIKFSRRRLEVTQQHVRRLAHRCQVQVTHTPQRRCCPNPACQATILPNGQAFSLYWDMLAALAKLSSISCSAAAITTHPDASKPYSTARPVASCMHACDNGASFLPHFVSNDSWAPWQPQPRAQMQSRPSTAPLLHGTTSLGRLSSMNLYQMDTMPTKRSTSASGRSSSGHLPRARLRDVQRNIANNGASMTSPVPGRMHSQPLSSNLTCLSPRSFTCPVVCENAWNGTPGGSLSHGVMFNTPTSDAAPVYVPPSEFCSSAPINAPSTPRQQLGRAGLQFGGQLRTVHGHGQMHYFDRDSQERSAKSVQPGVTPCFRC